VSDSAPQEYRIEWHSGTLVVIPNGDIESMKWDLIDQAADVVMTPIEDTTTPLVIFDLSEVDYFGSVFLSLLLKCYKAIKPRGGEMVLCAASPMAAELLQITSLHKLWTIYETREQAIEALGD